MIRRLVLACFLVSSPLAAAVWPAVAWAQPTNPGDAGEEGLDAERYGPPAIALHRDFFAHGAFLEVGMGVRGFVGGIGELSQPGPFLQLSAGYEAFRWLWVGAVFEASLQSTDAPAPPTGDVFETFDALLELRLQANAGARVGLWMGGSFGVGVVRNPVLGTYGVQGAGAASMVYGGQAGLDLHLRNRHASLGLLGGLRIFHSLAAPDGAVSYGVHGSLYYRHVFG